MLNIQDLNTTIDSLVTKKGKDYQVIATKMHNRSNAKSLNNNLNPIATVNEYKGDNVYDLFPMQKQKRWQKLLL